MKDDLSQELLRNMIFSVYMNKCYKYDITLLEKKSKMIFSRKNTFKDALSSLRQFLATESPLKMMKKAFYFTLKALFFLQIFKFLSWLFGHVAKRLDKKD